MKPNDRNGSNSRLASTNLNACLTSSQAEPDTKLSILRRIADHLANFPKNPANGGRPAIDHTE